MTTSTIAAVLTCHNRRELTLACLSSLRGQNDHDAMIVPIVVDDGSSDGTAEAIQNGFPEAIVIRGDGSLFWNNGMHRALSVAFTGDYDYYLWLNDDTQLDDDAIATLLSTHSALESRLVRPAIVVGSTRDPRIGEATYGGRHRPSPTRRMKFTNLPPLDEPQATETMNGNIVLVPRAVVRRIGNLDPEYEHGFGDQDYGLRARMADCEVWLTPGTIGACARNAAASYGARSLWDDLGGLGGTKGLPLRSWARFCKRWAGRCWPAYFASPYLRRAGLVIGAHLTKRMRARPGDRLC
jgi:GT2 family glycosyltransferase